MEKSNWFTKHTDTVIILGAFAAGILWLNGKFNDVETRLTKIETVLVLQKIMPQEFCAKQKGNDKSL